MLKRLPLSRRLASAAVADVGAIAHAAGPIAAVAVLLALPLGHELARIAGLGPGAPAARAAEADELAPLQSLFTEDVLAVVRVRLDKVDASWAPVIQIAQQMAVPLGDGVPTIEGPLGRLKLLSQAGAESAYVPLIIALDRQASPTAHAFLLTARSPDAVQALQSALEAFFSHGEPSALDYSVRAIEGGVAVATGRGWKQVDEGPASPRAELSAAFAALGDAPLAIAVVPSADQRRVLSELLAAPSGEGPEAVLSAITSSLEWMAVGYEPGRSLAVVVQTNSADAARSLAQAMESLLDSLSAVGAAQPAVAQLAGLLEGLKPVVERDRVVVHLGEEAVRQFEGGPAAEAQLAAQRQTSIQRLKMIGVAMHNAYQAERPADGVQRFPDAAIRDEEGKPLLSWRVRLLPYLEEGELFDQFRLDEPWDSEHNLALVRRMPDVYQVGSAETIAQGKTCLLLPIGAATGWPEGRGLQFRQILDGASNTIMLVEADDAHAVVWTAPDDLAYDPEQPAAGLGGHFGEVFLSLMFDGSVRAMPTTVDANTLRALFTPAGRDPVN